MPHCTDRAFPLAWRKPRDSQQELLVRGNAAQAEPGTEGEDTYPVVVHLSNGASYGCDLVVSATGVIPDTSWLPECLERGADGSLLVDRCLSALQHGKDIHVAHSPLISKWASLIQAFRFADNDTCDGCTTGRCRHL